MDTVSPPSTADEDKGLSDKRKQNYWEPIYNPGDKQAYIDRDWKFDHEKGFEHCRFNSKLVEENSTIDKITFTNCDFTGESPNYIKFKKCTFELCDFGSSIWNHSKFTDCTFNKTSFSSSSFINCEFRQCKWKETGLSGNTTILTKTVITNPRKFIDLAFTNVNPKNTDETANEKHQKFKLEKTKSTVARTLLKTLTSIGDEQNYYEAAKVNDLQSLKARRFERLYKVSIAIRNKSTCLPMQLLECSRQYLMLLIILLETSIIYSFGLINAWGASISRVVLTGFAILIIFSLTYYYTGFFKTFTESIIAGFDITLLIGYTKHANKDLPIAKQALLASNGLLGLIWYAIIVPTIVNKISRVR